MKTPNQKQTTNNKKSQWNSVIPPKQIMWKKLPPSVLSNIGEEASLSTHQAAKKNHRKWAYFVLYLYISEMY